MQLIQNKLAVASLILGILALVSVIWFGPVIAFSYLGIPAIVTGAILLSRIKRQSHRGRAVAICEAILGIILGVLPLAYTFLVA
jgi:hypothetical protein